MQFACVEKGRGHVWIYSAAVSVEDCCRLQNYCWEAEWESLIERERTQALLRKGFLRRREHLWDWKEAGRMVAVWLPAEGAWQAVLLVAGLASLSSGSDGKCRAEKHLVISVYLVFTVTAINEQYLLLSLYIQTLSHESDCAFYMMIK
ncbi:hypothetical protein XENOCAPTIV_012821 [Xenoophorus captivus]|uniref:Uncharacterized protein n=1 Tax=Xenoophorus captivus TaxID=1517983 RepID=A0ABV0SF01_9TELE